MRRGSDQLVGKNYRYVADTLWKLYIMMVNVHYDGKCIDFDAIFWTTCNVQNQKRARGPCVQFLWILRNFLQNSNTCIIKRITFNSSLSSLLRPVELRAHPTLFQKVDVTRLIMQVFQFCKKFLKLLKNLIHGPRTHFHATCIFLSIKITWIVSLSRY